MEDGVWSMHHCCIMQIIIEDTEIGFGIYLEISCRVLRVLPDLLTPCKIIYVSEHFDFLTTLVNSIYLTNSCYSS